VYSSLQIYGVAPEKDEFRILYELARAIDGVEYVGSISQRRLADALSEADILAYPNTFPEMACIAVMEAMAAGCLVLTSKLGALPETSAGFGFLMDPASDVMGFAANFIRMTTGVATAARDDPEKFRAHIDRQTAFVRDTYTWQARAREVARWAAMLPSRPGPGRAG
ncbi:MAG: glycosyltransferase, partial [Pseudomonadota bacterium]